MARKPKTDTRPELHVMGSKESLERPVRVPKQGLGTTGLSYAKAGVTDRWQEIDVIDAVTGDTLRDVIEVDCASGVVLRYRRDRAGHVMHDGLNALTETITNPNLVLNWHA